MKRSLALAAVLATLPAGVSAQALQPAVAPVFVGLPTNTEVLVTLNDELNSQRTKKGQLFDVSVARDVMQDGRVVIPRGTPGRGEIVFREGKGAFGKSGKLEIVLRSLQVDGRTLPITGRFRQHGQGNTGAVVGTIVLAGVVAGAFVTGHSAVIEQGREFKAFTAEAWPGATSVLQVAAIVPPPAPLVAVSPASAAVTPPAPVVVAAMVPAAAPTAVALPVKVIVPAAVSQPAPVRVAAVPAIVVARPIVPVAARPTPALATFAMARPVAVAAMPVYYTPDSDAITAYQRRLDAQRGIHGGDPRQGWSISD